jgi:Tol biopolymer transport system component
VGQLAFASTRSGVAQIYLINFDGSDLRQLTSLRDGACQPAWSPDGQRLAFTSPCNANKDVYPGAQIFIMNVDGTGLTPLPTLPGGDFDPAWSPDGKRLAFSSMRDRHAQLYVYDLEANKVSILMSSPSAQIQPSWSPSGAEILYTDQRSETYDIYLMPEGGGSAKRLTRGGGNTHPDWSSDGSLVLYEHQNGGVPQLVATALDTPGLAGNRACAAGKEAGYPMAEGTLSPDQSWIALETWPSGSNHEIAVMQLNCTNFRVLAEDPGVDFDPAWRP